MDNKQLVKDVKFCKSFLGKRYEGGVLNNIVFEKNNMFCTNNDVTIKFKTELQPEKPFMVNSNIIKKILEKQKDFEIKVNEKMDVIRKNGSEINIEINYKDIDEYPDTPVANKYFCSLDSDGINNLKNIIHSAATDTIKPAFNAIYFEKTNSGVTATTTDSRRLSHTKVSSYCSDEETELLVPLESIQLLLKLKPETIIIKTDDKASHRTCSFSCDDRVELTSRLYDGKFPNYKQVIPKTTKELERFVDRKDFIEVLEQAMTVAIGPTFKSMWYVCKDNIAINITDPCGVEFNGRVKNIALDEEVLEFKVNTHFVLETLNHMVGKDVMIQFNGVVNPIKICDGEITAAIMPINIKKT